MTGREKKESRFSRLHFMFMALVVSLSSGCCHENVKSSPSPRQVVVDYASNLKEGRIRQALKLVSSKNEAVPTEASLKTFKKSAGTYLDELLDEVISMKGVSIRWTMVLPDGQEINLLREKNAWRVLSGPILPGWPLSAKQALLEFSAAVDHGDCKAVTSFAPPEVRAKYSSGKIETACKKLLKSLAITVSSIKKNISKLVYLSDTKAELNCGDNQKVILVKKGGRWFIKDM